MATMISEVYSAFRTAGVPEQEARKAAEALSAENLATKNDVAEVKQALSSDIAEVRQELANSIAEVRQELASSIAEVRQELASSIAEVRQELASSIAKIRQELTSEISEVKREVAVVKWMLGIVIIAVVLPLLKPIAGI